MLKFVQKLTCDGWSKTPWGAASPKSLLFHEFAISKSTCGFALGSVGGGGGGANVGTGTGSTAGTGSGSTGFGGACGCGFCKGTIGAAVGAGIIASGALDFVAGSGGGATGTHSSSVFRCSCPDETGKSFRSSFFSLADFG